MIQKKHSDTSINTDGIIYVVTFVLKSVINRITLAPQFCASVRGITSNALPIAAYGHLEIPVGQHGCIE